MSALLPCPFCGGEGEYDNADDSAARWIWCKGCGAKVTAEFSDEAATAAWNRRHVPEGMVLVPVDLPKHMRLAGLAEKKRGHSMPQIWRAMLAAHFAEQDKATVNRAILAAAKEPTP